MRGDSGARKTHNLPRRYTIAIEAEFLPCSRGLTRRAYPNSKTSFHRLHRTPLIRNPLPSTSHIMELITQALAFSGTPSAQIVAIPADRFTLNKRRWRGTAEDGREFGFDLERPLGDGEIVYADEKAAYRLTQRPEPVLMIDLGKAAEAARLGWLLGNLHFRIALADGVAQAPDDPAVRLLLEREQIRYQPIEAVFRPLGDGHSHGHGHSH